MPACPRDGCGKELTQVRRGVWRPVYRLVCDDHGVITKKELQAPYEGPVGTCQVCFHQQKLPGGVLSLHGYKRPGEGYIIGRCWGVRYPPFEESCERTKEYLVELRAIEQRRVDYQARLERNEVEHLSFQRVNHNVHRSHPKRVELVRVERGAAATAPLYTPGRVPSFEELRQQELDDVARGLVMLRHHIKDIAERIRTWKPQPLPKAVA